MKRTTITVTLLLLAKVLFAQTAQYETTAGDWRIKPGSGNELAWFGPMKPPPIDDATNASHSASLDRW
jgi:hypothetical protein